MAKDSFPTVEIEKIVASSDQASVSITHSGTSYWLWFGRQGDGSQGVDIPAACDFVRMVRESERLTVNYTGTFINGQYPATWISVVSAPVRPPKPPREPMGLLIVIVLLAVIVVLLLLKAKGTRREKAEGTS